MTPDELIAEINNCEEEVAQFSGHTWVYPALRAVVELHKPYESADMGMCCQFCTDGKAKEYWYPCPTIQAIEKELA